MLLARNIVLGVLIILFVACLLHLIHVDPLPSSQSFRLWRVVFFLYICVCLVVVAVVFLYTSSGHTIGRIKCYFKDFILVIKRLWLKLFFKHLIMVDLEQPELQSSEKTDGCPPAERGLLMISLVLVQRLKAT